MEEKKLTPWQQYKKNLGDTRPWDIMNPKAELAEKEVSELLSSLNIYAHHPGLDRMIDNLGKKLLHFVKKFLLP